MQAASLSGNADTHAMSEQMPSCTIRLTPSLVAWLDANRAEGENRSSLVRRLLGQMMRAEQCDGQAQVKA